MRALLLKCSPTTFYPDYISPFHKIQHIIFLLHMKNHLCLRSSFLILRIEILRTIIRLYIKCLQQEHTYLLCYRLIGIIGTFFHLHQEIMPVSHKAFILLQIWCINPLFHFDFCTIFFFTFMCL